MFKFFRIVLINFIVFLGVILLLEVVAFSIDFIRINSKKIYLQPYPLKMESFDDFYDKHANEVFFRKASGLNYKKPSIFVFGCSFAYGDNLDDEQTFAYKLSELSRRPVYNRAIGGAGLQHMFFQLKNDKFFDENQNPEYIIYVFNPYQIDRLYTFSLYPFNDFFFLKYSIKNGELVEDQPVYTFLYRFYFVRMFDRFLGYQIGRSQTKEGLEKNFDFMEKFYVESKKIADKKYPGVKFVILKYMVEPDKFDYYLSSERWSKLEDKGFIVLDTKSLINKDVSFNEYRFDDGHPNEKAWDLITPALVKKLNL